MANNLEINGTIISVLSLQTGTSKTGSDWQKQDVIIQTDGEYPKQICVTFFGKAITSDLLQGAKIKVSINLESREYNGKWYTNVNAWKILEIDSAPKQPTQSTPTYEPPFQVADTVDDLPF